MKKESIILIVVIVVISVYLIMRKTDRTHYELPTIPPVKTFQLTKVEIRKAQSTIVLSKTEDDRWQISPQGYPADNSKIEGILDALGSLTITALISESESYSRYELDEEKKIGVKAWAGSNLKREFELGKPASSFQHTFVTLTGDKRVYHARGNFRTRFDQPIEGFRDKNVLSFQNENISEISILSKDKALHFIQEQMAEEQPEPEAEVQQPGSEKTKLVWKTPEGREGNEEEIKKLLNALSALRCDQFIDDKKKEDFKEPTHTFLVKGEQEYSLSLFANTDDDKKFPAVSSGSDHPFLLPEWQVSTLTKKLNELVKEPEPEVRKKK